MSIHRKTQPTQHLQFEYSPSNKKVFVMERIVLVVFLLWNNGRDCELHQFGCVSLNLDDFAVHLCISICLLVQHKLAYYTNNSDNTDGS
jgi:hypothetical protein